MSIAYLYSRYPVISQTFCDSEMLALESLGVDLEIASINPPSNSLRHERLSRLKAETHYLPPPQVIKALQQRAEESGEWQPYARLAADHHEKYGIDFKAEIRARNALSFSRGFLERGVRHIHVHFANRATHSALFIHEATGIPFSFTAHAQDFMVDLGSHDLLREMCAKAAFVVAVSDHSRNKLAGLCPDSADKIIRIYNGIEIDRFPLSEVGLPGGALRILSIGRLIEFKGFHHLIDACARLSEKRIPFQLRIIGDGPWREQLQQQIDEKKLGDSVSLMGVMSQHQVKEELRESDVFALASCVDGKGASDILPTVIAEAMAARLPIVSTKLVGIPEMVEDSRTGLLVEPDDVDGLASALERLQTDPELSRTMGQLGRKRAESLFSLDVTAPQLLKHFEAAASSSETTPHPTPSSAPALAQSHKLLYLLDHWPSSESPDRLSQELAALGDDDAIISCGFPSGGKADAADCWLDRIEYLPDGMALESDWAGNPLLAREVEELKIHLAGSVSGEEYLLQARRALHLSIRLKKRGVTHVHAARADSVLCVWILKRLGMECVTAGVEENPPGSRALLAKLLKDFDDVSVSDQQLREKLGLAESSDFLQLKAIELNKRIRIGPLKIRVANKDARTAVTGHSERFARWWSGL